MNNSFYLTRESYQEPDISFDELEAFVHRLRKEVEVISSHEGNQTIICDDIYDHWEWHGHKLGEIWQQNCKLERDLKARIINIIEKAQYTDDINIKFGITDETTAESKGLLTFNIRDVHDARWQIDAREKTWYKFCLNVIQDSSIDSHQFLEDCKILFDNIEFLDRNYNTIDDIYGDFKNRILHHLSGLNLHMRTAQKDSRDLNDALSILKALGDFDELPSTEGNAKRKKDFPFVTDNKGNRFHCDPHIKLCKSDKPGDNTYYQHRIYFHVGIKGIFGGKIIVGHIGKHL